MFLIYAEKMGLRRELCAATCSYHVEASSEESCCPPPPARCRWPLDSPTSAQTPSPQKNSFIQATGGAGLRIRITSLADLRSLFLLLMQTWIRLNQTRVLILIRIESGFNRVRGSGSRMAKMTHKISKKF